MTADKPASTTHPTRTFHRILKIESSNPSDLDLCRSDRPNANDDIKKKQQQPLHPAVARGGRIDGMPFFFFSSDVGPALYFTIRTVGFDDVLPAGNAFPQCGSGRCWWLTAFAAFPAGSPSVGEV